MKLQKHILFFVLILCQTLISAQDNPMIHITENDGLVSNTVRCAVKDSEGYMWFGTDNGLSKFDGSSFKNFSINQGLPGNKVWALATDESNRIYVGCYLSGLAIIENDKVTQIYKLDSASCRNSIRNLHYSKQYKALIIGTDFGAHILKDSIIYYMDFPLEKGEKSSVLDFLEYDGSIYFTAHNRKCGIYQLNIDTTNTKNSTLIPYCSSFGNARFTLNVLYDTLYTNLEHGLISAPIKDINLQKIFEKSDVTFLPWSSCTLNDSIIIYGSLNDQQYTGGTKQYNAKLNKLSNFQSELSNLSIWDLVYNEEQKILWCCTSNGIYAMPESPFEITDISQIKGIIDIAFYHQSMYVLAEKGLFTYKDDRFELIRSTDEIFTSVDYKRRKNYSGYLNNSIPLFSQKWDTVLHGLIIKDNKFFIITSQGNIQITDSGFETYLPFENHTYISDGESGYYYIPNYLKGQYFKDIKKVEYSFLEQGDNHISSVESIVMKNDTYFFASIYNGLFALKDTNIFALNETNSSISNFLSGMELSPDGEVWCTSSTGNLYNIGFSDSLYIKRTWNENNSGILGNNYKWLRFDERKLYIGTNKKLVTIPINELYEDELKSVNTYDEFNGYPHTSVNRSIADENGNIYVFTDKELVKINGLTEKKDSSKLIFNKIEVNSKSTSIKTLNDAVLSSETKQVLIQWHLLKYPFSKNVSYDYRVNNEIWNAGNSLKFEFIKAGKYKIEVRAKDIENSKIYTDTLIFKIEKPLIQNLWFILLLVLLVLLLVLLIYRKIHNRITQKKIERLNLIHANTELRIKSMQGQMNPHFIFNSLNSIQSLILTERNNEALEYLGTFGKLIRGNLEHLSQEYITLYDEIEFLKNYINIEKLRFKKKLNIKLENQIADLNLLIPPMLIQPLIENAIKHGVKPLKGSGTVGIGFQLVDNYIVVTIKDNGVGRNNNHEQSNGNNLGLKSINRRLELLNKKNHTNRNNIHISDSTEDENGTGTMVKLTLDSQSIKRNI